MARVSISIPAPPDDVFEVLLDPWTYSDWVVGAHEIRAVDEDWPAEGSSFHHSIGNRAATVDDRTEILELRHPTYLKLRAFARPVGIAHVVFEVRQQDGGSLVTLEEVPAPGTRSAKIRHLLYPAIFLRNLITLRSLRRAVVRRRPR